MFGYLLDIGKIGSLSTLSYRRKFRYFQNFLPCLSFLYLDQHFPILFSELLDLLSEYLDFRVENRLQVLLFFLILFPQSIQLFLINFIVIRLFLMHRQTLLTPSAHFDRLDGLNTLSFCQLCQQLILPNFIYLGLSLKFIV